ncbi:homogenitisate phytyltransferase [Klebsormidium nitens]|uniref:Homogenitisate phytyltransferase n=1 Tax=Klebsormidium nitens TaxID=105231 RepID=A0A1Y1HH84_KLENI|nr:homogenitisate phytyltransferase [Klebsormidium nitens]|eukprot:GAQ77794.1 homogenitisate phytyltransferase [Klebsormidium nitens]
MGALTACHGGTQPLLSAARSLQNSSNSPRQALPIDAKQQSVTAVWKSAAISDCCPHGNGRRRFLSGDLGVRSFPARLHGSKEAERRSPNERHRQGPRASSLAIDGGDDADVSEKLDTPLQKQRQQRAKRARTGVAQATAGHLNVEDGEALIGSEKVGLQRAWDEVTAFSDALVRFARPHTIIGTSLSIVSVSLLAMTSPADFSHKAFIGILQALIPALQANVAIVGLNQVYDIEIDKINKPTLPLASGEFSVAQGVGLVAASAIASLLIGLAVGSQPLLWTLSLSLLLGFAYSTDLPFLRWKKYPILAAGCIFAVRAVLVQIGFYLHMQVSVLKRTAVLSRPVLFGTAFMSVFSLVIAFCKDIPDLEGDRQFNIQSFTVRMGQQKMFWICVSLLGAAYVGAIGVGFTCSRLWSKVVTVGAHAALGGILWHRARHVDFAKKASIVGFYMFVWKLFYAEYFLLPFVR